MVEKAQTRKLIKAQTFIVDISVFAEVTQEQVDTSRIVYEEVDGVNRAVVEVAGEKWEKLWKNGSKGVWLVSEETSSSVRKESEANDEDVMLQSADKVFDRLRGVVFGKTSSKQVSLMPPPSRLDALVNQGHAAPFSPPKSMSTATALSPDKHSAVDEESLANRWNSFRMTQAGTSAKGRKEPSVAPKLKAKAEAGGGRKRKSDETTDESGKQSKKATWIDLGDKSESRSDGNRSEADMKWYTDMVDKVKEACDMELPTDDCDPKNADMKAFVEKQGRAISKLLGEVPCLCYRRSYYQS